MSMQSAHQNGSMLINFFRIKYLLLLIITLKYIVIEKKTLEKDDIILRKDDSRSKKFTQRHAITYSYALILYRMEIN